MEEIYQPLAAVNIVELRQWHIDLVYIICLLNNSVVCSSCLCNRYCQLQACIDIFLGAVWLQCRFQEEERCVKL